MQNENKMMQIMIAKLASQPIYMAWYLDQYSKAEKISFDVIREKLNINEGQLGKLAMCKVPDGLSKEFATRLKTIEEFTGANRFMLASIIRKIDSIESLRKSNSQTNLLAARKLDNSPEENGEDKS
jgi:hypothetical protein